MERRRFRGFCGICIARLIKCFIDSFSCVLIYSLAKRNFGEQTARIAAVFYMLMPNTWYYCGITLKETEMNFIGIVFVERADLAMRSSRIKIKDFFVPLLAVAIMLTFRTALAAVMVADILASFIVLKDILYKSIPCSFFYFEFEKTNADLEKDSFLYDIWCVDVYDGWSRDETRGRTVVVWKNR